MPDTNADLSQFDLTGRTALITGSSQGIGLALAKGLANAGAAIVLNGRDQAKLELARKALAVLGSNAVSIAFDVTDHRAARTAIDDYESTHGPIDICVNNAGMQHRGALEEFESAAFEKLLATNISSVFNVGQAVARHMIKRGAGKVINIASVQSSLARPSIAPYTATKGAVTNLTKGMATDWAKYGLQCNAIAPGYISTDNTEALRNNPERNESILARIPAGRWGQPEDFKGPIIFLCSEASSYMHGGTMLVDGGWMGR